MEETKKCPFCAEEIKIAAKKCKHCREWLDKNEHVETKVPQPSGLSSTKKGKKISTKQKMIGVLIFIELAVLAVLGFKASVMIYDKFIKGPYAKYLNKELKTRQNEMNFTSDETKKDNAKMARLLWGSEKEIREKKLKGEALSGKEINDKILQKSQEEESQLILD